METTGKKYFNKSAGFTLLEVLIALVILAVGLLGTILLETTTVTGNSFSRELQTAAILAEDFVEQVQTMEFSDSLISAGTHPTTGDISNGWEANPIDEAGNNGGMYSRTWSVADNALIADTKTVSVTVSWVKKNVPHSIVFTTIKHE